MYVEAARSSNPVASPSGSTKYPVRSPGATVFGVAFIALLERGLTMLDQKAAVIQLIEGAVLLAAVVLARQERKQ